MNSLFITLLVSCLIAYAIAECPSGCSGHGTCGAYDACTCFRNWMSNDCSERICPFGNAHVDTPLGDLDSSSGRLTGPNTKVVVNSDMYPQGTSEQFPSMQDSSGKVLSNTAHYYRECSNKGICDRSTGQCECFEGYDGSACQRASCPISSDGVCSGHGTCASIQELAAMDHENIYRLWDEDVTMGCHCDAGYTGNDCSARSCKFGNDPLYADDFQNVRHANFTVQFYVMNDDHEIYGNYSLIFTDIHGEDWQTEPIDIDANCGVIQHRLESLPNDVIPKGSVLCFKHDSDESYGSKLHTATDANSDDKHTGQVKAYPDHSDNAGSTDGGQYHSGENVAPIYWADVSTPATPKTKGYAVVNKFTLAFPGNPGSIAPLKINRYLDGKRPTLFSTGGARTGAQYTGVDYIGAHIYSNGFHGEETDYVNDECEGVLVGLASDHYASAITANKKWSQYLTFDDDIQFHRLKKCLGDADGVKTNNVDVYDWDFGSFMNPHLIKLIDATQDRFTEFIRADGTSYKVLAPGQTPSGGGDGWIDRNQDGSLQNWENNVWDNVPMTRLCNNKRNWVNDNYLDANSKFPLKWQSDSPALNLGERGWCRNYNPPGFFAVIYFDDCTANGVSQVHKKISAVPSGTNFGADHEACGLQRTGFRLMTRPAVDYSTITRFHVFTTKGTLQQVSAHASAYTQSEDEVNHAADGVTAGTMNPNFIHGFHSNVIHTKNATYEGGVGAVDCETAPVGTYGNLDCLRKGDKIFLLNLGSRDSTKCMDAPSHNNIAGSSIDTTNCFYAADKASFNSNPMYPNMYTVMKIGKENKDGLKSAKPDVQYDNGTSDVASGSASADPRKHQPSDDEGYRHTITLDMGVNAMYLDDPAQGGNDATIYKFYPPTLATTGTTGYTYVAECSNRGICDSETGICECFSGYTGQACDQMNALAM